VSNAHESVGEGGKPGSQKKTVGWNSKLEPRKKRNRRQKNNGTSAQSGKWRRWSIGTGEGVRQKKKRTRDDSPPPYVEKKKQGKRGGKHEKVKQDGK